MHISYGRFFCSTSNSLSDLVCHVFLRVIANMLNAPKTIAQEIINAAVLNAIIVVSGMSVDDGEDWLDDDSCLIRTILS